MKFIGPNRPKLGDAEIKALSREIEKRNALPSDTIRAMIRGWRGNGVDLATASPEWEALAQGTRDLWGGELDLIDTKWGETPIELWNDYRMVTKVIAWRDSRKATPRAADQGVYVLSELLGWGKLRAMLKLNVADDIPTIYQAADRAEIIWTAGDLAAAEKAAATLKRPRAYDIVELATVTGFRRADLCAVTIDEVSEHAIVRTAQKRSKGRRRRAVVPLIPESRMLIERLKALPRKAGVRNLLVTSRGTPWQPASMTEAVIALCKEGNIAQPAVPELDIPERRKHLHDCRGTFVTHLCRAGLTNEEIANVVAWSVESVDRIRRTYVDDAAIVVALSERIRRAL
jgi:integrase